MGLVCGRRSLKIQSFKGLISLGWEQKMRLDFERMCGVKITPLGWNLEASISWP